MKKPEFILRIIKTNDTQQFSCLGEQLAEILSAIYVAVSPLGFTDAGLFVIAESRSFASLPTMFVPYSCEGAQFPPSDSIVRAVPYKYTK
ncbi:hypothetical protein M5X00_18640 [Paenibacillus alvei]|uniref:hypothetical protein n=1 Tax=Paenibacillus alvei TaxID=44250 RepID=UPI00228159A3|nr:hypothetical protein [Paenibacillus alvei]MCY9707513.1 hypothetical protein [Paenibacillus alvei]MCY9756262.1 hypothetical protein [Paenibacillus alvei]